MPQSIGVEKKESLKDKKLIYLTPDEYKQYNFIIERFVEAKNQRESIREEFDDLSFEDDYWLNRQAINSYLRVKRNDDEVRINTGTTEKKIEFVLNELLALNLQPEVKAYDQNDLEIAELGQTFEEIVKRTNEMEQDEDKYLDAFLQLLGQRICYVKELWVEKEVRGNKRPDGTQRTHHIKRCEKRVLSGLQVYPGDISLPAWRFNDQPYVIEYERMNYWEAETIYGDWDRWQYVKPGMPGSIGETWLYRMNALTKNEVEILHYKCYPDNEYQVTINGVPMLKVGTELPYSWEGYDITAVVLKSISHDFLFGRPLTASAKTLQALDNETIRNIIRKFRQAIEPPTGVKGGKQYSRDIWNPGSLAYGVSKDDFSSLINHTGVTQSEFAVMQLIESKISEFIGATPLPAGSGGKKQTATEIMQAKSAAVKMLGLAVLAVMRLKKNLTYLRIDNVLENYSKPTGKKYDPIGKKVKDIYATLSVNDTEVSEGKNGKRIIKFMDRDLEEKEQRDIYNHELKTAGQGSPESVRTVNIKKLNDIKVDWYVNIVQKEKDSSELAKAMFNDKLNEGVQVSQITGQQINPEKLTESFERTWQVKDFFQKAPPQAPPGASVGPQNAPGTSQGGQSDITTQMKQGMNKQQIQPSLNTMVGAQ